MSKTSRSKKEMQGKIIQINEDQIHDKISQLVKGTIEDTINTLLDAEADELVNAGRYERSEERQGYRSGAYQRKLQTSSGDVTIKMPKLKQLTFESAIIERYRTRQISVEEAIVEMYLAGVSVRRVEDITEALWGSRVSAGTVSRLNQKAYGKIDEWRNLRIEGKHPYVFVDGIYLKRSWGGEVRNIAILVAIGVNSEGFCDILGLAEGSREDKESWREFFRYLTGRGLSGVHLVVSDKAGGALEAISEFFPSALWQRCMVHFYRNVFTKVPYNKINEVSAMLKAIHAQENISEARKKAKSVVERLKEMKLKDAAKIVEDGIDETLTYFSFPSQHHRRIRTNNRLERLLKEIRRRTKVVGAFPDGQSALMLACARARHVASKNWSSRVYLNMDLLKNLDMKELMA